MSPDAGWFPSMQSCAGCAGSTTCKIPGDAASSNCWRRLGRDADRSLFLLQEIGIRADMLHFEHGNFQRLDHEPRGGK